MAEVSFEEMLPVMTLKNLEDAKDKWRIQVGFFLDDYGRYKNARRVLTLPHVTPDALDLAWIHMGAVISDYGNLAQTAAQYEKVGRSIYDEIVKRRTAFEQQSADLRSLGEEKEAQSMSDQADELTAWVLQVDAQCDALDDVMIAEFGSNDEIISLG